MSKLSNIFPVRKLQLDADHQSGRYWFQGKPFETYWFNALSLGLPTAERYAISTIKALMPKIKGKKPMAEAKSFIGQEATHAFLHDKCNRELEKQGFRFWIEPYAKWRISVSHWMHPLSGVALTMTWEHMTTIICEHTLNEIDIYNQSEEPFRALWTWHCVEELDHKSLAYDVYKHSSGSYVRKIAIYLWGTSLFVTDFAWLTLANMVSDKRFFDYRVWLGALKYTFGKKGFFWFWFPRWLAYFNPKFHPDDIDHKPIIKYALSQLDGRLSLVSGTVHIDD